MSPLAVLAQSHEQAASHPQYDASGPGPLTAKPRTHGGVVPKAMLDVSVAEGPVYRGIRLGPVAQRAPEVPHMARVGTDHGVTCRRQDLGNLAFQATGSLHHDPVREALYRHLAPALLGLSAGSS